MHSMQIEASVTDEAVQAELGARLARLRLERNLTQADLAERAGVDRRAVASLEAGNSVRLTTFIRILRALGLVGGLDAVVPQPAPSPIELLDREGRRRRRARPPRRPPEPAQAEPWTWGDEP